LPATAISTRKLSSSDSVWKRSCASAARATRPTRRSIACSAPSNPSPRGGEVPRRRASLRRHVALRMTLAEEHFARAERAEVGDRRETTPSPLDEAERHAMARTDHDDAVAIGIGDGVLRLVGAAIQTPFALAFRRHQHHHVAAAIEERLLPPVVAQAPAAPSPPP